MGTRGLNFFQGLPTAREFLDNRLDGGSPHKRFWILVPGFQEQADGGLQIWHAAKDPATNCLVIQGSEPALDQVHPTGTSRDKMEHETRMALEPSLHIRMLVRPVVIQDEMEQDLAWELPVEGTQEAEELLIPMPLIAAADDLSLQCFQGGE